MKKFILNSLFLSLACSLNAQTFDSTGLANNWKLLNNSYSTWEKGAFDANRDLNNASDFGWGEYDISTHIIKGDSIYIIKTVNGNYKAISIDQLASGVFTITYSNLDGSQRKSTNFDRTNFPNRNFMYFSIDNEISKDLEPNNQDWDIVFRKFLTIFPGFGAYPVSGVLSNLDVSTSQVEFVSGANYSSADTAQFPLSSNISEIGYDWKNSFAGITYDTLVYYVLNQSGVLNEIKFIDYSGSATAVYKFEVNGVLDSISLGSGNTDQVYYSLENKTSLKVNQDNDWDIALFAKTSFANIPIRINDSHGAELYVYPKSDISHWNSIGLDKPKNVNLLSVYPNPSADHINLVINANSNETIKLEIFDHSARLIKSNTLNLNSGFGEYRLDLEGIAKGAYFLKISTKDFTETSSLIVQP
tara:strand:- start:184538 stop:185785 length:1248 start_codon:yes stop_codon:yes gene_type:complete